MRNFTLTLMLGLLPFFSFAQAPKKLNAAEIKQALNKLEVLGSVLYLAAHPDDENTRFIAYLANELKMRTGYLSMTRGDGGQNLVGTEIREYLGIIRTRELLAARRIDGGEQFFARTNDFGFSKNPDETFTIWNRDQALADVVWNIRRFRPDVIITRFDTTRVPGGRMHGHHTASSLLAQEAFDLANDPNAYPEQLEYVKLWQPKGLYWNTYNFGRAGFRSNHEGDSGFFAFDVGKYNPLLGKSYDEISAISRSQHKSQGFGSTGRRGSIKEFLMHWKGPLPEGDIFADIDVTWGRVKGGRKVGEILRKANLAFDMENPAAIVPLLMDAREVLLKIEDNYWKNVKIKELDLVIKAAMGMYLEVAASSFSAVPGEPITINYEATNRSSVKTVFKSIEIPGVGLKQPVGQALGNNQKLTGSHTLLIPTSLDYSQPYWLEKDATLGMYRVDAQEKIGLAENPAALQTLFSLEIDGRPYTYPVDLIFKRNDRVKGEFYRPFVITPPVMAHIREGVLVFPDNDSKTIHVVVTAGKGGIRGKVKLNLPAGWKSSPAEAIYDLKEKNAEAVFRFQVLPPTSPEEAYIGVEAEWEGKIYDRGLKVIDYDHIPIQTVFPKSNTKVTRVNLRKKGRHVGYIMGSGDAVPEALEQVGYQVSLLDPDNINAAGLEALDAVIVGVRAYNTVSRMRFVQPELMEYVKNGGTVINQYNTSMRSQPQPGPYPLSISRDRVTVEEAPVRILEPDHPLIKEPNQITEKDFEGWVQERGLYFPNRWDERYTAILSSNDPGESPKNGGLLVAKYGQGYFIYTGYSWFRELPAGVPGAFRIFTNMISVGRE